MKKRIIPIISDCLFYLFTLFIINFFVFNYFFSRVIAIVLALTLSLFICVFIYMALVKRQITKSLSIKETKELNNFLTLLGFLKKKDIIFFINHLYNGEIKNGRVYLKKEKKMIVSFLGFNSLSKADIVKEYNYLPKDYTLVIYYSNLENGVLEFSFRFNKRVILLEGKELFFALKKSGLLPKKESPLLDERKVKYDFSVLFNKKIALKLLGFGAMMLFFSYFVPYKIYYLVIGSLFILLAIINRVFGKEKAN